MSVLLFANNAISQLAAGISAVALTASLTPGSGALFPTPAAGQYFKLTFADAATGTLLEVVHVTNVTGDTVTMVRGQEGTTAKAYLAGDNVGMFITAGTAAAMVQAEQQQLRVYTKASAVAGTANAITATLASTLTTIPDGLGVAIKAAAANTTAVTLVLTLGVTAQSSVAIVKFGNQALGAGDIPGAGYPMELVYSNTYGAFVLTNPGGGYLSNAVGVPVADAGGTTRVTFNSGASTDIFGAGATPVRFKNSGGTVIAAITSAGIMSALADAVASGDVPRFGQLNSRPGHTYLSSDWVWLDKTQGLVLQYGQIGSLAPSATTLVTFPTSFASIPFCIGAWPTSSSAFTFSAETPSVNDMTVRNNNASTAATAAWIAIGKV